MEDKVKPRKWIETIPGMWMCGNCGEVINVFMTKCPKCGKEIAWDGSESGKRNSVGSGKSR